MACGWFVRLLSVAALVALTLTWGSTARADLIGGLFDPHSIAMAPDGLHVYAGQGLGSPYVGLRRDPATGLLAFTTRPTFPGTGASAGGDFTHTIIVAPDSAAVYDSLNGNNALRQMSVVGDNVVFVRQYVNYLDGISGMTGPQTLALSPDGACLYVTTVNGVTAFVRRADDTLTFAGSAATGVGGRAVALADRLYLGGRGFARDPSTCVVAPGVLTAAGNIGAGGVAASPDGHQLYVAGIANVEVLQRNTGTGDLTLDQTLSEGAGGIAGLDGVSDIVVAPDGRHVYTSASVENAIAVFDRDALTGRLVQTAVVRDGLNGVSGLAQARSLVISPDGANVYAVASGTTSAVTAFSRNATTGALTFLQRITDADGPPRYTPATGAPAPAQRRALMLSGFTISKRKFARGAKGVSLRFVLSEPATATITLNREQAGKRRGSRCVPPTRKLRKAKNCTRRVRVRTLKVAAKAGRNTVALATKSLLPAKYVAHIRARVATDGRTSSLATLRFTVTKPKPKRART